MSLRDQLLALRAAARSLDDAVSIEKCLSMVKEGSPYNSLFFGELSDERWLPKLKAAGFFDNLPGPIADGESVPQYPRHPALFALKQLGGKAPVAVTQILDSLKLPKNPAVGDQVMLAITTIGNPVCIDRLAWTVERVMEMKASTDWLWFDEILVKWHSLNAWKVCLRVLSHAIMCLLKERNDGGQHGYWQISEIDQKVLAPIAEPHPLDVARFLVSALTAMADVGRAQVSDRSDNEADVGPNYDFPYSYWFENIESETVGSHELESTFTSRLLAVGSQVFSSTAQVNREVLDAMLREDRWHLFRRIRWSLYADSPGHSLAFARREVLERIPYLGDGRCEHSEEFAKLLFVYSKQNGRRFLKSAEVDAFFEAVMNGPIYGDGKSVPAEQRIRFQRRQLSPIHDLLKGSALKEFDKLSTGNAPIAMNEYSRRWHTSGGFVEQVAPPVGEDLPSLSDTMLWHELNSFNPDPNQRFEILKEESVAELGKKFAELLHASPDRFEPSVQWWQNLFRPMILQQVLEGAKARVNSIQKGDQAADSQISDKEWGNWFGCASRILELTDGERTESLDAGDSGEGTWSRMVVVQFLGSCVSAMPGLPAEVAALVGPMLKPIITGPDPRLDVGANPIMNDWYSTAINSVRGSAIEVLFNFALAQKNDPAIQQAEPWIFGLLAERLQRPDESSAVFAMCGARLRLLVHLFGNRATSLSELLLPAAQEEPSGVLLPGRQRERRTTVVTSHLLYDRPAPYVVQALPSLPQAALDCLPVPLNEAASRGGKDLECKIGTHLAFYYWNNAYRDEQTAKKTIDAFFAKASGLARASTIGEIARIFAKAEPSEKESSMFNRVMSFWDQRVATIETALTTTPSDSKVFDHELGEFLSWFKCECFPLPWRFSKTLRAIQLMTQVPRLHGFVDAIGKLTADGSHIDEALALLVELMPKPSEGYRWEFSGGRLKKILELGFASNRNSVRQNARKIQEALLRQECFEYLDLEDAVAKK